MAPLYVPRSLWPQRHKWSATGLKQRARRLIWLNPLLGLPGYEPKTAAMQAVLPLLDLFAPAHNVESLIALEEYLIKL